MILSSEVSHTLRSKAVKTTCYLLNWLLTSAWKKNKVSMHLLFQLLNQNKIVDSINLSHLQSFKCTAYVHIFKKIQQLEAKFKPQSNKRILVDYEDCNQYWVWLLEMGKGRRVMRACNIQFNKELSVYNLKSKVAILRLVTNPMQDKSRINTEQENVNTSTLHSSQLTLLSSSSPYVSLYPSLLLLSSWINELKDEKEEKNVTQLFLTVDLLIQPQCSERQYKALTNLEPKAIVALLVIFDAFVDAVRKNDKIKLSSECKPQTFQEAMTSYDWIWESKYSFLTVMLFNTL